MLAAGISKSSFPHSVLNMEELFKVAQLDINVQSLGMNHHNLDLYCIFDLAVGASSRSLDKPSKD